MYLQVAEAVLDAVREKRILPGVALPGVRELSERLGVTVNTILAALRELQAQGWVISRERSGFFIADQLPESPSVVQSGAALTGGMGFELPLTLARSVAWQM